MSPRLRQLVANLLLAGLASVVCLVLAEAGLRAYGYSAPIFRQVDERLGWKLRPSLEGHNHLENVNYVRLNSAGFHDVEHRIDKPPGVLRVALVGDSFTQATEVPLEAHFGRQLERWLSRHNAEVLSFGVVGYGTAQELLLLEQTVLPYDPDVVVLMMYLGNDVSDNHHALAESLNDSRPYFGLEGGDVKPIPGFPSRAQLAKDNLVIRATNASRLVQLVKEVVLRRHGRGRRKAAVAASRLDQVFVEPAGMTRFGEEWEDAWRRTERLLLLFKAAVERSGAKLLVVGIPHPMVVHPDPDAITAFAEALGVDSLEYPDRRLSDFAQKAGFRYFSLAPSLRACAATSREFFHGFAAIGLGAGHWNETGHAAVAHILSREIARLLGVASGDEHAEKIAGQGRAAEVPASGLRPDMRPTHHDSRSAPSTVAVRSTAAVAATTQAPIRSNHRFSCSGAQRSASRA